MSTNMFRGETNTLTNSSLSISESPPLS